ncbi:Secreted frizzled-related protein 2 [Sarcoptes scabiei]|uniref:Secreted frizzled-related protein 2 n=1 Tax=Sarcoptes scabiei TaxID=52283 RepID=A0A834RA12_SARSC|nr:Secreted frizzled-related protein 2 [Sarcoptes scabiei]
MIEIITNIIIILIRNEIEFNRKSREMISKQSNVFIHSLWFLSMSLTLIQANTFIWDPENTDHIELIRPLNRHSTFSSTTKCVSIPTNLTLCYGIKYREMRLPNLLYHETINEVIEQSSSWIQLIHIGCHTDTRLFLCSLFSPVCLDQTIPPCRSLCENVKNSCEPSMKRHGFNWPPMMQCNLFPIDNNMCIESQTIPNQASSIDHNDFDNRSESQSSGREKGSRINPNRDRNKLDPSIQRSLLEGFCNSDWAIKIGANSIRNNHRIRVKKYKTIFGTLNLMTPFTLILNQSVWLRSNKTETVESIENNQNDRTNKEKFLIIGKGSESKNLTVNLAINWNKNGARIKKILRMIKSNGGGCKKYRITAATQTKSLNINSMRSNGSNRKRNRIRKKNSTNLNIGSSTTTTTTTITI